MSETKKAFCGLGPVSKTKRRGSAQECAEANQVRYYGVVKIDPELLQKKWKELEKLQVKLATMNIVMKKQYQIWKYESSEKKKEALKKKLKELASKFEDLRKEVQKKEKENKKYIADIKNKK